MTANVVNKRLRSMLGDTFPHRSNRAAEGNSNVVVLGVSRDTIKLDEFNLYMFVYKELDIGTSVTRVVRDVMSESGNNDCATPVSLPISLLFCNCYAAFLTFSSKKNFDCAARNLLTNWWPMSVRRWSSIPYGTIQWSQKKLAALVRDVFYVKTALFSVKYQSVITIRNAFPSFVGGSCPRISFGIARKFQTRWPAADVFSFKWSPISRACPAVAYRRTDVIRRVLQVVLSPHGIVHAFFSNLFCHSSVMLRMEEAHSVAISTAPVYYFCPWNPFWHRIYDPVKHK